MRVQAQGFSNKKISSIIFHPKKLSGITVRVENVFGTKQAKRPTTHKSRSKEKSNTFQISWVAIIMKKQSWGQRQLAPNSA